MAAVSRRNSTVDELDDLDMLMDRMSTRTPSRAPGTAPFAFPTQVRSSSLNGSASPNLKLSPRSSLRSVRSAPRSALGREPVASLVPDMSALASASSSSLPILERGDHPTLVAQLEWAARDGDSPLASPTSNAAFADNDTISVISSIAADRPTTPSMQSLPPTSPLSATFSRRSPSPNSHAQGLAPTTPLRLVPRSPLKDRIPFAEEDLDFLKDAPKDSPKTDDGQYSARSSTNESARARRLREDIERTARRLRSSESMRSVEAAESSDPASIDAANSGLMLGVGTNNAPQRSRTPTSESFISASSNGDDAASVRSAASSGPSSIPSVNGGYWTAGRNRAQREPGSPLRPRPRELKEWSQSCWVWQPRSLATGMSSSASSSSLSMSSSHGGGKLGKSPLMLDVSAAMKRKMASKRESSQLMSPTEALMYGLDDERPRSSKSSKSIDKAAKATGTSPSTSGKEGMWRRATSALRGDGYLRIFSEDKVSLHSIHVPSMSRSDIRAVDHSLFDDSNCVVVYRRQTVPPTPFTPISTISSTPSGSRAAIEEPLYLRLTSIAATQSWLVMVQCFATPEILEAALPPPEKPLLFQRRSKSTLGETSLAWDDTSARSSVYVQNPLPRSSPQSSPSIDGMPESRCRVYRSLAISINEGRGIGERGNETVRTGPKSSLDSMRHRLDRDGATSPVSGSIEFEASPGKMSVIGLSRFGGRSHSSELRGEHELTSFCEIVLEGEVIARTSERKSTSSPFFNENFLFTDLPSFIEPVSLRVWQTHKSGRASLVGSCTVRVSDLPRAEMVESWFPVRSPLYEEGSFSSDTVGELSLGIKVSEDIVLPLEEYGTMLELLVQDAEADLPVEIAQELPSALEDVSRLLLRIYHAEGIFLPRIMTLAEREIGGSAGSTATLFRGNSILAKSIEIYMRLIGQEYLESSIGRVIRQLCLDKVEVEIDPSKMKTGARAKELQTNARELNEWTMRLWNAIYDSRQDCPSDLRAIFHHIRSTVVKTYGEEQQSMRSTAVSAFIFLRFFVPAVLNPKLFGLVSNPPSAKCQRTLTLIAKSLQGLANFTTFGQKEPWMSPMNPFVQDNTASFVDFIEFISTPIAVASPGQDWTSSSAAVYMTAYRLRSSLPPLSREGIPLLPHLIDLSRELSLLAAQVARAVSDRSATQQSPDGGRNSPSLNPSKTTARSVKFSNFAEACIDVRDEARRRGGPLYGGSSARIAQPKSRARAATVRTSDSAAISPARRSTLIATPSGSSLSQPSTSSEDVMHIRSTLGHHDSEVESVSGQHVDSQTPGPLREEVIRSVDVSTPISSEEVDPMMKRSSPTSSRKDHRNFTVNGTFTRRGSVVPMSHPGSQAGDLETIVQPTFVPAEYAHALRHSSAIPLTPATRMDSVPATITDVFFDTPASTTQGPDEPTQESPHIHRMASDSYTFTSAVNSVQVTQETTTSWSYLSDEQLDTVESTTTTASSGAGSLATFHGLAPSAATSPSSVPMRAINSTSSWTSVASSTSAVSVLAAEATLTSGGSRRGSAATSTGTGGTDDGTSSSFKEAMKKSGGFFKRRKGSKAS